MISGKKVRAFFSSGLLLAASTAALAAENSADAYVTHAFVRNAGQYRADVAYAARLRTNQIFVLDDGRIVHALPIERTGADSMSAWVVVEGLQGATVAPRSVQAQQGLTFRTTAFSQLVLDEDSYSALAWHDAWPGVDMRLQVIEDRTERVFLVAPGADPKSIALTYDGVHFTLDESGGLIARAGEGGLTLSAPVAFQDTAHGRVPVEVRYVVDAKGTRVSFDVGAYDESLPLTIDPVLQSTYFGFDGQSAVTSMAVDPASGDLIVAGIFQGVGVPGVAGGFQSVPSFNMSFVARIDATLRRVIQATYLGGASASPTFINAVAIHPQSGEIYVAGRTTAPDFPGGGGGARPVLGGSRDDGFVSRFSPDLRQLRQTTYTNQALNFVWVHDLAISATTGDVYVAGEGDGAGYVLRFNQQLTVQSGRVILEGNNVAWAYSVALNQTTGDVYVAGATLATVFPQIAGGAETVLPTGGAGEPVFVARFNADLSQHLQSTYLSDVERTVQPHVGRPSPMLVVHPVSGEVYVAGMTSRTDLPTAGAAQPVFGGGQNDLAISRLSPDLRQKHGATYFGGTGYEEAGDLTFTPDGATLYLTGMTFSDDLPGTAGGALSSGSGAFVARLSASLATLEQTTYFTAGGNINGQAVVVHPSTSEVYFGGQCYVNVPETTGGLQPEFMGFDTGFGTGCLARFDALLAGGDDTDPDAFSFADQFAVAPGGTVTSAPVRIEGITLPVIASATNGSFSIDGGPFDATAREVRRGQTIRVRHVAAPGAGVATNSVLNVGSRSDTFTSVSAAGVDSAPDTFAFAARNPVALNVDIASAAVIVSGIDAPASISIANGEYSIDGGNFTAAAGTINGGQSVVVRHRSAAAAATVTQSTLTIGGVSANFRSTTDPVDSSVHPFSFLDVENVTPDIDALSDPIVVMGVNVSVPVSVVGGEWSTDGVNFRSDPGVVSNLTPIILRKRTGPAGTTVSATLIVGDQSDDWVLRQPQLGDTTPNPFTFDTVTNATPLTNVVSNDVTITGVNVPVSINVTNAHFFDPVSGLYMTSGYLSNGDTTRLRILTSRFAGASVIVLVRIGTVDATFEVRNAGGDSVPDPFDFIDQTGVATGVQVISNSLTLSGLIGDTTAQATGCELVGNINVFGRVENGARLTLRATSAATADTTTTCTVNIGGVVDLFRVTTASRDSVPNAFNFDDQNGVATGAQVISNEIIVSGLVGDTNASVTGCELSVNSGTFGTTTVQVVNGDRIKLRVTASATANTTTTCTVDIGGVTDQIRVTTAASAPGGGSSGGGGGGGGGAFDAQLLLLLLTLFLGRVMSAPGRRGVW
jgi:hypothetical protein